MPILNTHAPLRSLAALLNIGRVRNTYTEKRLAGISSNWIEKTPRWLKAELDSIRMIIEPTVTSKVFLDDPMAFTPPERLHGNYNAYQLALSLSDQSIVPTKFSTEAYRLSKEIQSDRQPKGMCPVAPHLVGVDEHGSKKTFLHLRACESMVISLAGRAKRLTRKFIASESDVCAALRRKLGVSTGAGDIIDSLEVMDGSIRCVWLWDVFFFRVNDTTVFMLQEHVDRCAEMLRSFSTVSLILDYIPCKDDTKSITLTILRWVCRLGLKRPEWVGEVIKAARNIAVARLDTSDFMGTDKLLISEMGEEKSSLALEFLNLLKDSLHSKYDVVNLTHLYKAVLHPDIYFVRSMEKLDGLSHPGSVSPEALRQFDLSLRRAVLAAGRSSGHQLDLEATSTTANTQFIDKMKSSSISSETIRKEDIQLFAGTRFAVNSRLTRIDMIKIPPQSKSSAPGGTWTLDKIDEMVDSNSKSMFTPPERYEKIRPVNDIITVLNREDELDGERAFRMFEKIVSTYERYEEKLSLHDIDAVTDEQIAGFMKEYPEASWLVLTEPKLKEKHKELTRMFYMCEQRLKAIFMRVERLVKQLVKKQPGVSITRSYFHRRKDMNMMADAMNIKGDGMMSIFFSFDLSSFSMKYPHSLLRVYGTVLSEITGIGALRRLDVLFKLSKVVHMTRGWARRAGFVRGAFEGAFNFLWTSSHAVILERALLKANVKGAVLTYSDDGLLRIAMPDTASREEVQAVAKAIQDEYRAHGLSFNFAKTMCSTTVWEYLGEICHEGKLLPTYIKELMSIGSLEGDQGLDMISTRMLSTISQACAAASARAPASLCEFLALYEVSSTLLRLYPLASTDTIKAVVYLPTYGYRVPCFVEMATSTSVTPYAEMLADFELTSRNNKEFIEKLCYFIGESLKPRDNLIRDMILGRMLILDRHDMTGRPERQRLATMVSEKAAARVKVYPFDSSKLREISTVLESIRHLDLKSFSQLICDSPDFSEYQETVDNCTKGGALNMLEKTAVVRVVRSNKRCLNQLVTDLNRVMSNQETLPLESLMHRIHSVQFCRYSLAKPRPSIRTSVMVINDVEQADFVVTFNLSGGLFARDWIGDIHFTEQVTSSSRIATSEQERGHLEPNTKEKYLRRFARTAGSIVLSNAAILNAVYALSHTLGHPIPILSPDLAVTINRVRQFKMKGDDADIKTMKTLFSRCIIRPSARVMFHVNSLARPDMTTAFELSKFLAVTQLLNRGILHKRCFDDLITVNFRMLNFKLLENRKMTPLLEVSPLLLESVEHKPAHPIVVNEFSSSLKDAYEEEKIRAIYREVTFESSKELAKYAPAMVELWISTLARYIEKLTRAEAETALIDPSVLPRLPVGDAVVNKKGCERGLCLIIDRVMRESRLHGSHHTERESYILGIDLFNRAFETYIRSLSALGVDLDLVVDIDEDEAIRLYQDWSVSQSIYSATPSALVVVARESEVSTKSTIAKTHAILAVSRSTEQHLYRVGKSCEWNNERVSAELGLGANCIRMVDCLLDACCVLHSIFRASEHRPEPYNKIMADIELCKFYTHVRFVYRNLKRELSTQKRIDKTEMLTLYNQSDIRLDYDTKEIFKRRFASDATSSHADHISRLETPLVRSAVRRAFELAWSAAMYHSDWGTHVMQGTIYDCARNTQTIYKDEMLAKANDRLVLIHPSHHIVIGNNMSYLNRLKMCLVWPDTPDGELNFQYIDTVNDDDCLILFSCFTGAVEKSGGCYFRLEETVNPLLAELLSINKFTAGASTGSITKIHYNRGSSDSFYKVLIKGYANVVRFMHHTNLRRKGDSCVIRTENDNEFIGYAYCPKGSSPLRNTPEHEGRNHLIERQLTEYAKDTLITEDAVSWASYQISERSLRITQEDVPVQRKLTTSDVSVLAESLRAMLIPSTRKTVSPTSLLSMASILSSTEPSMKSLLSVYCLVRSHIMDMGVQGLPKVIDVVRAEWKSVPPDRRSEAFNELRTVFTWAALSHLRVSEQHRGELDKISDILKGVADAPVRGVTISLPGKPKHVREIPKNLLVTLLGMKLSDVLFDVPDAPENFDW